MVYYIADTHFGHEKIIKKCARPFASVYEMNEALIAAWNERVGDEDTIWILGDMFHQCANPEAILWRLKGRKRLVLGNHDETWTNRVDMELFFDSVDWIAETQEGDRELILCHYPMMAWKHKKRAWMVHGHIHNDTDGDYWHLIRDNPRLLNAGVDVNGYRPVTFEEMEANNAVFKVSGPRGRR